jgi:hypothetical protein
VTAVFEEAALVGCDTCLEISQVGWRRKGKARRGWKR